MDIKKLTQEVLLKNMTPEQQMAVLDSVQASVREAKAVQKQKIAENVDLVLQALKRIEADMIKRVDGSAQVVEARVKTIKDGKDGKNGIDGKAGRDGKDGKNGADGRNGKDGINGVSGERGQDGVGVQNAHIDFDGSLIISLTNGQELNVGEVVPFDVAEKIRVIGNGGGTSQYVVDTLADLQTQINNISGGLTYKGTWNAFSNTPTLVSSAGTKGWYYVVSTAGSTNLNGVTDWQVGDWAIYNGSTWQKIDQSNLVTSVAGRTGDITLTSTDVGLSNVDNKSSATIRGEITSSNVTTALGFTPYNATNPSGYTSNTGTVTSVAASAGTGISVTGSPITSSGTLTIINTAPDQTVVLTAGTGVSVTGTYPNFTVTNTSPSSGGTVTSVTGTSPVVSSGGNTPAISLAASYGDTQNPYASKTANYILAAPNGSSGAPTFRAIVAADIPTLNQNTTGTAANVTGVVAQANGGTGTTTGYYGFKNRIINGAMVIDQRNAGASVTTPTTSVFIYTLDRWNHYVTQGSKFTVQQNAGSVTPPVGFSNYLGVTSTSAYSVVSGDLFSINQAIEGFNTADLAWGTANAATVTLSFWVRSSLTGTFGGSVLNNAYNRSYPFTYTVSAANTWEQKTITIAGDTSGTWVGATNSVGMRINFSLGTGSTYNGTAGSWSGSQYWSATGATSVVGTSGATFYITGVQLEKGSTATSFDYRPFGTELALCQRYFISYGGSVAYERFGTCLCQSTTTAIVMATFPVEMRASPTFGYSSFANLGIFTGAAVVAVTSIGGDSPSPKIGTVQFVVAAGLVATATYQAVANNTTSARVTWSAEL